MILDLLFVLLVVFIQVFLHELTHAFFVLFFKQKLISIKFWPHRTSFGWIGGSVIWKQMSPLSKRQIATINLSPLITGVLVFIVGISLCYYLGFSIKLFLFAQVGLLDTVSNLVAHFYKNNHNYDYTKGMTELGFSKTSQTTIAIISIIILSGIICREYFTKMV
jgi:Zn-dependent protease